MAQADTIVRKRQERQLLATQDDFRASVVQLTTSALRGLAIMTPDLEPDIYAHPAFLDALKKFILARPFARTRVLLTAPERARKTGNEFLEMGRRLNSYIEFRNLPEEHRPRQEAFFIADDTGVVYRPRSEAWEGIADPGSQAVAQMYLETFDNLWQIS
jgi:hypothetical protein